MYSYLILVIHDIGNLGQDENLQKSLNFGSRIFLYKLPKSNLVTVIDKNKILRVSEFRSSRQWYLFLLFNIYSVFHLFRIEWKIKKVTDMVEYLTFKKYIVYYGQRTPVLKKCAASVRVAARRSILSPDGKWVALKTVKTSNISGTMPLMFFNFSSGDLENNWLFENVFGITLTASIKDKPRVSFHNFTCISTIRCRF